MEYFIAQGILEKPLPEETSEEYVHRFYTGLINSYVDAQQVGTTWKKGEMEKRACNNFIKTKDAPAAFVALMESLEVNENIKFSPTKQKKVLLKVSDFIDSEEGGEELTPGANVTEFFADMARFKKDQLTRRFFQNPDTNNGGIPYSEMIFGFPKIFTDLPEIKNYLEKFINDKTIFLFGGGNSLADITDSPKIHPKEIINFEPFSQQNPVHDNAISIYSKVDLSAADPKIIEMVNLGELPKANEIWSTFSTPYYLLEPNEISENIRINQACLSENGNARIYPLQLQRSDLPLGSAFSGNPFEARKDILMEALKSVSKNPDFNISFFEGCLKIHKIRHAKE